MTRIVHLVENLELGGMERVIQSLVGMNPSRACVLCTQSGGLVFDAMKREGLNAEVLEPNCGGGWRSVLPLMRRLRSFKPFILHTHGAVRAVGRVAGRATGAEAIVHHMHGTEVFGFRQRIFERLLRAQLYLTCSKAVRDDFLRQMGPLDVEVLYNPIDAAHFRPVDSLREEARNELTATAGHTVILSIGHFVPDKGYEFLVWAAPDILSVHPKALFVFVGGGAGKADIERQAADFKESVRFLGAKEDVLPYLNACDVYVQPSVSREGLGLAVLEAMACRKPVIVSRTQGLQEAVGDCGVIVSPADARSLAQAVNRLIASPSLRTELAGKARARVVRHFSPETIQRQLDQLYERAMKRK